MKFKHYFTIAVCLLTINMFSQTSEEEFNYVTKGYKIQKETGLDMKKGYEFKDVGDWGLNYISFERKSSFKHLYRVGEDVPCATLMVFERTDTDYEEYVCIPHYDSSNDIWNKAFEVFKHATNEWTDASRGYAWGMLKMISFMSSNK